MIVRISLEYLEDNPGYASYSEKARAWVHLDEYEGIPHTAEPAQKDISIQEEEEI